MSSSLFIFDLDGTLIDCHEACMQAWAKAINDVYGWKFPPLSNFSGLTDPLIIRLLADFNNVDTEDLIYDSSELKLAYLLAIQTNLNNNTLITKPGVYEFLSTLRKSNNPISLATGNFYESTIVKLSIANLTDYFDIVVTGDDALTRHDIVLKSLQNLKVFSNFNDTSDSHIYFFGDTISDHTVAKELDLSFILVSSNEIKIKDYLMIIESFDDARLLSLIS